jgi:DMSO reductase family type II enzyme molybdopterin subunit
MVGACPYQVYLKDGKILFQEPAGNFPTVEKGVPDFNPMGCQKGACWHELLSAKERVLYPLKRAGERGSGKWQRISWDRALTEIADGIIDAIEEAGPESVFCPQGANACAWGIMSTRRFSSLTGTLLADFDTDVGDFSPGMYLTWGKLTVASEDDYAHSELIFIWNCNPSYTRIPYYHFLTEARYKGAEVVIISPDFNASAVNTDYHVPVKVGTDPALCLSMCKVIVDEGLVDSAFIKDQTDLPLLVRLDNRHFLRASDIEEDGRDDQFFFYDTRSRKVVEAPRGTLALGAVDPALEGAYSVTIKGGEKVKVAPVFELLKERLKDYRPEQATEMCGVHPDVIRTLARKVATKKTHVYEGLGTGKHYHGDLMGRSMYLLLALTGNWGKKGTGPDYWTQGHPSLGAQMTEGRRGRGAQDASQMAGGMRQVLDAAKAGDPTKTDEIASIEMMQQVAAASGLFVPPLWWWYYHVGYREIWNKRGWNDPSMRREFDDYFKEALEKGWWEGVVVPTKDQAPLAMIEVGGNMLRRTRGGQTMFLKHLWPKLKLIVSVDVRMSITGLFSDYVLPAAHAYERPNAFGLTTTLFLNMADKVTEPIGEAKPEWQIFRVLCRALEQRAKARGITEYQDSRGRTYRMDNLEDQWTAGGESVDEMEMTAAGIEGSAATGVVPEDTTIETLREKGVVRFTGWGLFPFAQSHATDLKPDETMAPLRNHVEKKQPYPTLVRRAQFYIDHDWFLEADEELPIQKDPPKMGGDYPLMLTSGHNRWSIHATHIANQTMLQTHRGHPHLVMSPDDAARRGFQDDEEVRVHNDMGSIAVRVKLSPSVRPGQVICYSGWDHYQFRDWRGPSNVEGAMIKWLHLAGGYGHLRYWPFMWAPNHVDRATRVEVSKIDRRRDGGSHGER